MSVKVASLILGVLDRGVMVAFCLYRTQPIKLFSLIPRTIITLNVKCQTAERERRNNNLNNGIVVILTFHKKTVLSHFKST